MQGTKGRMGEKKRPRGRGRWIWSLGLLLMVLWSAPVFAGGGPISGLKQTDAAGGAVTLSFQVGEEARQLEIYSAPAGTGEFILKKSLYTSQKRIITSVSVDKKGTEGFYDLLVRAYDKEGRELGQETLSRCPTAPARAGEIRQKSLYTSRKMQLSWSRSRTASGYQIETWNTVTGEKDYVMAKGPYGTVFMEQDMLYRVRVRGYLDLQVNGQRKRIYGPYRSVYTSQAPRVSFEGGGRHSVRALWKGVTGADSYAVFLSTKQRTGYRRIDVTREPQAEITGLTPGVRYYVLVRVNKRVDGVLHRSPCTYVYPVRIDAS